VLITRVGRMVIMLDHFEDPNYLKRLWCIYEVFMCQQRSIPIDVMMPADAEKPINEYFETNTLKEIKDKLLKVDAEKAEATQEADTKALKELIETNQGGFSAVNKAVKEAFIFALVKTFVSYCNQ